MRRTLSLLTALALLVMLCSAASASQSRFIRVSASSAGEQSNGYSAGPSISGTGRWVVFASDATNLVPNDTNAQSDVFVRDLSSNTIKLVSTNSSGEQGNLGSYSPEISADGRWVAFSSFATNLTPADANGQSDIFVHDLTTGKTTLVSINTSGEQGNDRSLFPSISGDGSRVAFQSFASDLVASDINGEPDVFLRDLVTDKTELISRSISGQQGKTRSGDTLSISANGLSVAFQSQARLVPKDGNGEPDVYVRDLLTGRIILASVSSSGELATGGGSALPSLSPGGRRVAFESNADNLIQDDNTGTEEDIFVHDLRDGTTKLVSVSSSGVQGDLSSDDPSIRRDLVLFQSRADNLVPNDTNIGRNIFLHNLATGKTTAVDVGPSGDLAPSSYDPSMDADGSRIAFTSYDDDLVPNDTNGQYDIFVRSAAP